MIKIIGALFLVGGATVLGISASVNLTVRARSLELFSRALGIMRSEIGERLTPLDELMYKLSQISPSPIDAFFKQCFDEMKKKTDIPFGLIWTKNISHAEYLKLRPAESETLIALGNVLGRYGAEEQKTAIDHAVRCMDSMYLSAEKDKTRLGKLYAKLGLICGIAVVIVFI
ncbi:MAG: stage III sporulation protein AB [Oscillospiraceae bacterium]|nr:stage III sporulation protein AB [Oscillospiraceae bacterium]